MKKILLIILLLAGVSFSQIDTIKVPGSRYNSADSVKLALDRGFNSVQLSGTDTIPGEKIFINNKTVFSGDSVGVRGKLNVNKKITIGDANAYLEFNPVTVIQSGEVVKFDLKLYDSFFGGNSHGIELDANGNFLNQMSINTISPTYSGGETSYEGGTHNATDYNWLVSRGYSLYVMNGIRTDGSIFIDTGKLFTRDTVFVKTVTVDSNYTLPTTDGASGQVLKTNGAGTLTWQTDATGSGGTAYADSVAMDGRHVPSDSLRTIAQLDAKYVPLTNNGYLWLQSDWLDYSASNEFRLGKSYNTKRFNNGAYSDVWNIDYVIPPYNLSSNWLNSIEHRTDYYNDTLNTVTHSDILNVDGTGTPIWRTNDVRIMGNEIAVNVGDLPDSTALSWTTAGLTGNKVILSEANKTAGATRFPMPVKGYEFKFGSTPYYTYPRVYGFYSDLTTNSPHLETAYHFYGQGDYPSYFGGNILTDGYIKVQDSIIIGSSTVKIYPDSITIGGTRVAKITEAGALDTSIVNDLIEANEDSSGNAIIGTYQTLDSIIVAFWNGTLGSDTTGLWSAVNSIISGSGVTLLGTSATLDSIVTDYWNGNLGGTIGAGSIGATELSSTSVTPGSYTNTNLTVDADGRITSASNGSAGGASAIDDLTDVTITTPSTNQALTYNGSIWVNSTLSGSVTQSQIDQIGMMWALLQPDTTGAFTGTFNSQTDMTASTLAESNIIGVDSNEVVRVWVDSAQYQVKYDVAGTMTWSGWQSNLGYYRDVDSVQIRHYTSATPGASVTNTIYLSNDSEEFLTSTETGGEDNTSPLAPTSYVAVGGTSEIQYVSTWTDPTASDLDSIRFYEGSSNDTTAMTWIASIGAGTETYTRTGRTAGTTYWSAVKAIDDSGNVSYFSNVDSATTLSSSITYFDDFTDGDYTSNPTWTTANSFTVVDTVTNPLRSGFTKALKFNNDGLIYASNTTVTNWEFDIYLGGNYELLVGFMDANHILNNGPEMLFWVNDNQSLNIRRSTSTEDLTTTAGYISTNTWYRIWIERSGTTFTTKIKGGAFGTGSWTTVSASVGTNPFTDATITTSTYFTMECVGGASGAIQIANIRIY